MPSANKSIAASWADSHILGIISLPIICFGWTDNLHRLWATQRVPQAKFGFINKVYVL